METLQPSCSLSAQEQTDQTWYCSFMYTEIIKHLKKMMQPWWIELTAQTGWKL